MRFTVGGGLAVEWYCGVWRILKDIDIDIREFGYRDARREIWEEQAARGGFPLLHKER